MRSGLLSIGAVFLGAVSLALVAEEVAAADCIVLPVKEPLSFFGLLEHRTFSAPIDDENATKGVFPEAAYLLKLDPARCFIGHDFLNGEVDVKLIQLIVSGDDDPGLFGQLKELTGHNVTVTGRETFSANSSHEHALVSMVISSVSGNRDGELQTRIEAEENAMDRDEDAGGQRPDMEPSGPTEATGMEAGDAGMETVEGFYLALAAGDGSEAAQHIIPAKRRSGPLSARAMTHFYRALKRPLRLLDVRYLGRGRYRASYTFETRQGSRCDGKSVVTTVPAGGAKLISRIVAENGC